MDRCVNCHEELAIMERNRSECWNCQERMSETYFDDHIEVENEVNSLYNKIGSFADSKKSKNSLIKSTYIFKSL
ncbi:hypothetical protein AB1283_05515 [Bacillus sp. S13(2024)]|uniref:hypothetical protein n=1 Tax=unclassified Bacillus (in: firmicutes) TaxID=185979 RepID=UPI003D19A3B2